MLVNAVFVGREKKKKMENTSGEILFRREGGRALGLPLGFGKETALDSCLSSEQ